MTVDRIWFILGKKLTKEATNEELQELEQLLYHHPELHYPIQNIIELWHLDLKTDRHEAIQALQRHLLRISDKDGEIVNITDNTPPGLSNVDENQILIPGRNTARTKTIRMAKYIGAACLIAIAVFLIQRYAAPTRSASQTDMISKSNIPNEISTKAGSHSLITLPDGSKVILNGNSTLTYDKYFDKEIREVQLNGEAYFDVTKNPDRPFIIHTYQMDIKVLGTAFNVKSYNNDSRSETSLIRGSIEIIMKNNPGKKIILKPTDKLIIENNRATTIEDRQTTPKAADLNVSLKKINYLPADSTVIETSWVDDRLIFRDAPFAEIALEMERKFGISILINSEKAKQFRFDGNFKNETVDQILNALQIANHFSYQKLNNTIIITN